VPVGVAPGGGLSAAGTTLRKRRGPMTEQPDQQVYLAATVTPDLIARGLSAAGMVKAAAAAIGGKGGGRADMAQGGGTGPERIGAAVEAAREYIRATIDGGGNA